MKATIVVLYLLGAAAFCKAMALFTRSTPKPFNILEAYYRRAVEFAGGEYVGIQKCYGMSDLVLFNSRKTGSTLAVKKTKFTAIAVQNILEQHEAEWGVK